MLPEHLDELRRENEKAELLELSASIGLILEREKH